MSGIIFTLTAKPSQMPLAVIRLGLLSGALMIAAVAIAFPFLVEDSPLIQNILFAVAALDMALAFILPKFLEKNFRPVEVRFYTDRLEFGESSSLPYASIRDVREEQSETQKSLNVTNIVIVTHGVAPLLVTPIGQKNQRPGGQPAPPRSDLLILPDVATEGDPLRKIQKIIEEYRARIS